MLRNLQSDPLSHEPTQRGGIGGRWPGEAAWAITIGVALISLAWFPPMPLAGAQLCDAILGGGVVLVLALATVRFPAREGAIAAGAYAAWAAISTLATGGSHVRLLGTWWLVLLALGVAALAHSRELHAQRIRRALVVAAVIGAVTGLVGALLWALGTSTPLLNHHGDLVPGDYPRIRGTTMRANALAGLVAMGLLLLKDVPHRLRLATGILFGVALALTFSRSWIALVGAGSVYLLALGRSSRGRDIASIAVVLGCVAVMLAVSWLGIRLDPTRPWDISITGEPGTRWVHLMAALETIAAHPLTGIGPGGFADPTGWDAHFTVANVAALMGIPAAIALVVVVGIALHRAFRAALAGNLGARGVAAGLVLFSLDALARDVEDQRALWILVGLAFALRRRP